MDYKNLVAIDIHTHAEISCWNPFDNYGEEYDKAAKNNSDMMMAFGSIDPHKGKMGASCSAQITRSSCLTVG